MEKFESEVKYISYPLEVVYGKMADLRNLSVLKERFADPNFQQAAMNASGGKVSESQFQSISEKLQNMQFDEDSVLAHLGYIAVYDSVNTMWHL